MATSLQLDSSDVIKGLTDSRYQGMHDKEMIYKTVKEYLNSQVECFSLLDSEVRAGKSMETFSFFTKFYSYFSYISILETKYLELNLPKAEIFRSQTNL